MFSIRKISSFSIINRSIRSLHSIQAHVNNQKIKQNQNEIYLPEKFRQNFINHNEKKLPLLDFNNPFDYHQKYCSIICSLNHMINFERISIENFTNQSATTIIDQLPKSIVKEPIECPTVTNVTAKQCDYYKHKDPNRFTHLTWVRHRKMKKHQRNKWRKKNLAMIKRRILERNIVKEKQFRAEILAKIREAEEFDPRKYVQNILSTIDNVPREETPQQRYERYMDLIRKNRQQTVMVLPKFDDEPNK